MHPPEKVLATPMSPADDFTDMLDSLTAKSPCCEVGERLAVTTGLCPPMAAVRC